MTEKESILVIEDDLITREMVVTRLKFEGYSIVEAHNGQRALKVLEERAVCLILLDVVLPDMNGLDILTQLRRTESQVALPVIMLTAKDESKDIVRAFELGANDYLTKPIDYPVALARIRMQLTLRRVDRERKKIEERYALSTQGSNDGLWDWDLDSDEIYYSLRWKTMLGYENSEIEANPEEWFSRVHPDDVDHLKKAINHHLEGISPSFESEFRLRHKSKTYRWMLCRGIAVRAADGRPYRFAGSLSDITYRKVTDPLTGQPNRILFMDRLSIAVKRLQRNREYQFGLMVLDVDRFQVINDSLGHAAGDKLLVGCVQRIRRCIRAVDSLARISGDEFGILLDGIADASDVTRVANRIFEEMKAPFKLGEKEVFVSLSIGIVLGNTNYHHAEEPLRDADNALNRAKTKGPANYQIFDAAMFASLRKRLVLETDLRFALRRNEFTLYYQPQIHLGSGTYTGLEALVRWRHPKDGMLIPTNFITFAERSDLILELGEWVLHSACNQIHTWKEQGFTIPIAVNISGRQLIRQNLIGLVSEVLEETGIDPGLLRLEITESTLMENIDAAIGILGQLKETGIQVAIDDFGTGYSSLSYLKKFPFDTLKVDRSFISEITKSQVDREIMGTIINLAHILDKKVVAEGVENLKQLDLLKSLKCDEAQGFYLSKPAPPEAIENLLAKQ